MRFRQGCGTGPGLAAQAVAGARAGFGLEARRQLARRGTRSQGGANARREEARTTDSKGTAEDGLGQAGASRSSKPQVVLHSARGSW